MGARKPSLAETLFQNTATQLQKEPVGTGNATQAAVQTATSAASGRAVGSGTGLGPSRVSNIQEQVAENLAQQQVQQTQQKLQTAAQGAKLEEEIQAKVFSQATKQLDERALNTQQEYLSRASELLSKSGMQQGELDFQKDKAVVEQAGFYARLANDQYVEKLQNEGARARINSAADFEEEFTRTILRDEEQTLKNSLLFEELLKADERKFEVLLQGMDLDFAIQVAGIDLDALQQRTTQAVDFQNRSTQQSITSTKEMAAFRNAQSIADARQAAQAANTTSKYESVAAIISATASGASKLVDAKKAADQEERLKAAEEAAPTKGATE